jgi:apolipoprotein N-acyltransferase
MQEQKGKNTGQSLLQSAPRCSALLSSSVELGLPIASGLLLSACFPPLSWAPLAWVALVPLAGSLERRQARAESLIGIYIGGLLFHLLALDFIRTADGGAGLDGPYALTWLLLGQLGAIGCVFAAVAVRRLTQLARWPIIAALPVVWITAEFARERAGDVISQLPFPWLKIGYTQAEVVTLIQIADAGGVWGVSVLIVLVNAVIYSMLHGTRPRLSAYSALLVAGAIVCVLAYGRWRLQGAVAAGPVVALTPKCWLSTAEPATESLGADIDLWSETAVLDHLNSTEPANCRLSLRLAQMAADRGALIVAGCRRVSLRGDKQNLYNCAAFFDPIRGYQGAYDKRYLVPWAEFAPWGVHLTAASTKNIARGETCPQFQVHCAGTNATYSCGAAICYDVCFADHFRCYAQRAGVDEPPDFFVAPSCEVADKTASAARMLLDMARFRAIESRRAVVRNVEGGYSGILDSCGRLIATPARIDFEVPTVLGAIPIDERRSAYHRWGEWLPILCLGVTILGSIIGLALVRDPKLIRPARARARDRRDAAGAPRDL